MSNRPNRRPDRRRRRAVPRYADVWRDQEASAVVLAALEDMAADIRRNSAVVVLLDSDRDSAKLWVEVGAAVTLDKPIVLARLEDCAVPAKLLAVADEVVDLPDGAAGPVAMAKPVAAAMDRIARRRRTER